MSAAHNHLHHSLSVGRHVGKRFTGYYSRVTPRQTVITSADHPRRIVQLKNTQRILIPNCRAPALIWQFYFVIPWWLYCDWWLWRWSNSRTREVRFYSMIRTFHHQEYPLVHVCMSLFSPLAVCRRQYPARKFSRRLVLLIMTTRDTQPFDLKNFLSPPWITNSRVMIFECATLITRLLAILLLIFDGVNKIPQSPFHLKINSRERWSVELFLTIRSISIHKKLLTVQIIYCPLVGSWCL